MGCSARRRQLRLQNGRLIKSGVGLQRHREAGAADAGPLDPDREVGADARFAIEDAR